MTRCDLLTVRDITYGNQTIQAKLVTPVLRHDLGQETLASKEYYLYGLFHDRIVKEYKSRASSKLNAFDESATIFDMSS